MVVQSAHSFPVNEWLMQDAKLSEGGWETVELEMRDKVSQEMTLKKGRLRPVHVILGESCEGKHNA